MGIYPKRSLRQRWRLGEWLGEQNMELDNLGLQKEKLPKLLYILFLYKKWASASGSWKPMAVKRCKSNNQR